MASESEQTASPNWRRSRKLVGAGPRKAGDYPWDPDKPPGGKIPQDKKPSNKDRKSSDEA